MKAWTRGQVTLALLLTLAGCATDGSARHFQTGERYLIVPGRGIDVIQVGASRAEVEATFGLHERNGRAEVHEYASYWRRARMYFFFDKADRVLEIGFWPGFRGALPNGIKFGATLDEVLSKSGGALKTLSAGKVETEHATLGGDRVLYCMKVNGGRDEYKFIDARTGVVYWFDADKDLRALAVFRADPNAN